MLKYLLVVLAACAGYGGYTHWSEVSDAYAKVRTQVTTVVQTAQVAKAKAVAVQGQAEEQAQTLIAATQHADLARAVAEAQRKAVAKYPALAVINSEMNSRFVFRYKNLVTDHSPRLQDPNWPLQLADEVAAASAPKPKTPSMPKGHQSGALASIQPPAGSQ